MDLEILIEKGRTTRIISTVSIFPFQAEKFVKTMPFPQHILVSMNCSVAWGKKQIIENQLGQLTGNFRQVASCSVR